MNGCVLLITLAGILFLSGSVTGIAQQTSATEPTDRRLPLIITDNEGKSMHDVQAADLAVKEDGAPVTINSLQLIEKPVHYGLLIDVSNSVRTQFPLVLDAARKVVSSNTREDQTFIVRFIDKFEMVQGSTSNKAALFAAIDRLRPEPGQTALFDSLYAAAKSLHEHNDPSRRKALVVITDGENRASSVTEKELFELLREADLNVFIIGLTDQLDRQQGFIRQSLHDRSVAFLKKLANETGGRLFFAEKNLDDEVIEQIARDLRRQYILKYRSPSAMTKSRHKVEVKVANTRDKKKRKAILRPAYTVQQLLNATN